jgi:hypothetical protein
MIVNWLKKGNLVDEWLKSVYFSVNVSITLCLDLLTGC